MPNPRGQERACGITSKDSDGDTITAIRLGLTQPGLQGNHLAANRDQTRNDRSSKVFVTGCVRGHFFGDASLCEGFFVLPWDASFVDLDWIRVILGGSGSAPYLASTGAARTEHGRTPGLLRSGSAIAAENIGFPEYRVEASIRPQQANIGISLLGLCRRNDAPASSTKALTKRSCHSGQRPLTYSASYLAHKTWILRFALEAPTFKATGYRSTLEKAFGEFW